MLLFTLQVDRSGEKAVYFPGMPPLHSKLEVSKHRRKKNLSASESKYKSN